MFGQTRNLVYKIKTKIKKLAGFDLSQKSFSQCGEDLLVDYVFRLRGVEYPTYMDIGANDPYFLSNTAFFYRKGCRGINIEANPLLINRLKRFRRKDINLNLGIGDSVGEMDFYIVSDPTLSSFSKQEAERVVATGKNKIDKVKKIRLTTIENIVEEYCNGKFPDFLSIDVEGMDEEILKTIPFNKFSPKVICVEAAEYSPIGAGRRKDDLISFVKSKGYYEYANTNLNAIMVKNEFWFI